ncbi:hypothetical protein BLOT_008262 [Blomia tropicalis]|nr:hypothetical protein BLOT_008262 [Blomia tropicalis]
MFFIVFAKLCVFILMNKHQYPKLHKTAQQVEPAETTVSTLKLNKGSSTQSIKLFNELPESSLMIWEQFGMWATCSFVTIVILLCVVTCYRQCFAQAYPNEKRIRTFSIISLPSNEGKQIQQKDEDKSTTS